ncbi:MAG: hypothetical protein ACLR5G_16080 [Eubacteriales bacterium]
MDFNVKEDIIALTPQWKGERFPDGRPRVPDRYLEAPRGMTLGRLKPIFVKGYESQFEGRLTHCTTTAESSSDAPSPRPSRRPVPICTRSCSASA